MNRGPAAEKTLHKAYERMTKIAEIQEDRNESLPRSQGEINTVMPEKTEIGTESHTRSIELDQRLLQDEEKTQRLETVYETLFGEGGFEILRDQESEAVHNPEEMGELSYTDTHEMLQELGLMYGIEITDTGAELYERWKGLEDYLAGRERLDDIEEEIGEMGMPRFLRLFGVDVPDADSYLSNKKNFKRAWQEKHDETVEIYMITGVLCSEGENNGETLRVLENVKEGESEHPEVYEEAGIRGIISGKSSEGFNLDGEKIFGKARTDYLNS
jgi:hypothetical protein